MARRQREYNGKVYSDDGSGNLFNEETGKYLIYRPYPMLVDKVNPSDKIEPDNKQEYTSKQLKDKFGTDDTELINAGKEKEDQVAKVEDKKSWQETQNEKIDENIKNNFSGITDEQMGEFNKFLNKIHGKAPKVEDKKEDKINQFINDFPNALYKTEDIRELANNLGTSIEKAEELVNNRMEIIDREVSKQDKWTDIDGSPLHKGDIYNLKNTYGFNISDFKDEGIDLNEDDEVELVSEETDGYSNVKNLRTGEIIHGLSNEHLGVRILKDNPKPYSYLDDDDIDRDFPELSKKVTDKFNASLQQAADELGYDVNTNDGKEFMEISNRAKEIRENETRANLYRKQVLGNADEATDAANELAQREADYIREVSNAKNENELMDVDKEYADVVQSNIEAKNRREAENQKDLIIVYDDEGNKKLYTKDELKALERENFNQNQEKIKDMVNQMNISSEDVLEVFGSDYGYDDTKSNQQNLVEQIDYMKYQNESVQKTAERFVEGGGYLIYNDDIRDYLTERNIPFDDDDPMRTYKKVIGEKIAKIYNDYKNRR